MPVWAFEFVALAAIWGGSFLLMRLTVLEFGVMPTAFLRVALAVAFLLPLLAWQRQLPALRTHARPVLMVGVLSAGLPFAFFAYALQHISAGLASILNATTPLFGALVAWAWLGDRPDRWRLLGLGTGFLGVALLVWDKASAPGSHAGLAAMACLAATLCYGLAGSYTKRYLTGVPPMVTATGSQIGAALALAVPGLWAWPAQTPGLRAWVALAVLAGVCSGVAYVLYFRIIAQAGPARALTVTFLIPVFAVVFGTLFLAENLSLWMLGCGLVVVLGTVLATGLWRPAPR